jgi:hypothetical protein
MTLSPLEKKYIKAIVERELAHFERDQKTLLHDLPVTFLKGAHGYKHFLEALLKKIQ